MSILGPIDTHLRRIDADRYQYENPLHKNKSDAQYEAVRMVYYPIREMYFDFFIKFCCDSDVATVNHRVSEELEAKGIGIGAPVFEDSKDLEERINIVFKSEYPASYEAMILFLSEVICSRLEFLCHYPDREGISPIDRYKKSGINLNME